MKISPNAIATALAAVLAIGALIYVGVALENKNSQESLMLSANPKVEAVFDEGRGRYSCLKRGSAKIVECSYLSGALKLGKEVQSKDESARFIKAARSADIKAVKDRSGKDYLKDLQAPARKEKLSCLVAGQNIDCIFDGKNLVTW